MRILWSCGEKGTPGLCRVNMNVGRENNECVGLVAWRNNCIKKSLDMHVVEDGWKTWYIKPHGDLCIMKAVRRTHYAVEEIFLDNESTSGYVNTCAPWRRSKFTSSYSRTLESKTWASSRCCEYGRQEEITALTSLEIQYKLLISFRLVFSILVCSS